LQEGLNSEGDTPDIRESAFRALMWSGDEAYLARASRRTAESLFGKVVPPRTMGRTKNRRPGPIRVGYVSCDFYDHATMSLLAGCLEAHDREKFEIFAFCHTEQQKRKGVMRQRFLAACDHMIDILDVPDELVLQAIRELGMDILIDLKGYTEGSRLALFAARAAPVQITWLGFPGSVQGVGLDYAITDRFVTPEGSEAHFEEKLLRMPVSYQCNDAGREPVERIGLRAEYGLPQDGVVFSAFHQPVKIRSPVFKAWMQILQQVENSVLWIGQVNGRAQDNLKRAAAAEGIDPARLIFAETVPLGQHLRRLPQADIALDTSPCNGHTTTSDALWAGVPVVTFKGTSFAGRVSESLLNAVGLAELVAADLDAYVELAVSLAQNPQRIAGLRTHLLNGRRTLPLFDSARFCRDLEELYSSVLRPESV
jgi:predicted O-linked N-acetylglucosamine transferase (SPINDLY family)